jgi:hypothetical protein
MTTIDVATASGAVIQIISGKHLKIVTPINPEIICPPIKFLGCVNGLWIAPKIRTLEAPNVPIRSMFSKFR